MGDRAVGINALRVYVEASLLPSTSAAIEYYDKNNPGWLALWGKMIVGSNRTELHKRLRNLAKVNGMSYPSISALNQIAMDVSSQERGTTEILGLAFDDMKSDVTSAFKIGVPLVVVLGIGYVAYKEGLIKDAISAIKKLLKSAK